MNNLQPHVYFAKNSKGRYLSILIPVPKGKSIKKNRITSEGKVLNISFSVDGTAAPTAKVEMKQFTINQKSLSQKREVDKIRVVVDNQTVEVNWDEFDNQPQVRNNQQAGHPHLFVENGNSKKLTLSVLLKNSGSENSPKLNIESPTSNSKKITGEVIKDTRYSWYSDDIQLPKKGETIVFCIDYGDDIQFKKKKKKGKAKVRYTRSH